MITGNSIDPKPLVVLCSFFKIWLNCCWLPMDWCSFRFGNEWFLDMIEQRLFWFRFAYFCRLIHSMRFLEHGKTVLVCLKLAVLLPRPRPHWMMALDSLWIILIDLTSQRDHLHHRKDPSCRRMCGGLLDVQIWMPTWPWAVSIGNVMIHLIHLGRIKTIDDLHVRL